MEFVMLLQQYNDYTFLCFFALQILFVALRSISLVPHKLVTSPSSCSEHLCVLMHGISGLTLLNQVGLIRVFYILQINCILLATLHSQKSASIILLTHCWINIQMHKLLTCILGSQILSCIDLFSLELFRIIFTGKDVGTYFWHGRDNVTTRELNPKVIIYLIYIPVGCCQVISLSQLIFHH